jgi:hypothetical protein
MSSEGKKRWEIKPLDLNNISISDTEYHRRTAITRLDGSPNKTTSCSTLPWKSSLTDATSDPISRGRTSILGLVSETLLRTRCRTKLDCAVSTQFSLTVLGDYPRVRADFALSSNEEGGTSTSTRMMNSGSAKKARFTIEAASGTYTSAIARRSLTKRLRQRRRTE